MNGPALKKQAANRARGRPFQPGESGNPAGRPPGTGEVAKLRAAIADHVPDVIAAMVKAAKEGDSAAARLLLERSVAPLRAIDQPAPVALPGATLTEQARGVLAAASAGTLTPSEAATLLQALGNVARIAEFDELTARIAALEAKQPQEGLV